MLQALEQEAKDEGQGISDLAAHYIDCVGGANGTFFEFRQFEQNAGDVGGPAGPGGAFWQQVIRQRPKTDAEEQAEISPEP